MTSYKHLFCNVIDIPELGTSFIQLPNVVLYIRVVNLKAFLRSKRLFKYAISGLFKLPL